MATAKATKAAPVEVRVIGQGTLAGSGYPFLLVTSQSEFGRCHVCTYVYEGVEVGSRMQCDCRAAQFGRTCRHVLVAREWLSGFGAKSQPRQKLEQRSQPTPAQADAAAASYEMLYGDYGTGEW